MSERHIDVRAERSRSQLIEALRRQLHERDPRDISVSSVCSEAGLSRPTFYQHFSSLDELAVAGIEQRLAELGAGDGQPPTSYDAVVSFLDELDSDRGAYRQVIGSEAVFSSPRDAVEDWLVVRLVEDHDGPPENPSSVRFAAGGGPEPAPWLAASGAVEPGPADVEAAGRRHVATRIGGRRHRPA